MFKIIKKCNIYAKYILNYFSHPETKKDQEYEKLNENPPDINKEPKLIFENLYDYFQPKSMNIINTHFFCVNLHCSNIIFK